MEMRAARKRGFLKKDEFIKICKWKSARPLRHYSANAADNIEDVTKKAFRIPYEKKKIELLTSLRGINIPTASAILAMIYPEKYGVIDIRVWKTLYKYGVVKNNLKGQGFSFKHWYRFLMILRDYAKKLGVSCRTVEITLFMYHKQHMQKGALYS